MVALGWGLLGAEATRLHTVRVVGLERASETQIRHLAGLIEGQPLVRLDLDQAVNSVERHPWVARATARRQFPDTVVIQVEERQVRALLMLERLYLVDTQGEPFRIATAPDLDHPIITGVDQQILRAQPVLARRVLQDALSWLDAVTSQGTLREADISEVRFDAASGYTLALRNGGELRLGFQDHQVLDRLSALIARGVDLSHPHRVDLGFSQIAVVTPL